MSRTLGFESNGPAKGSLYHATPFVAQVMEAGLVPPEQEDPLLVSSGELVLLAKQLAEQAKLDKAKREGRAYPDADLTIHPQDMYEWAKIFSPEAPRGVFLGNRSTVQNAYVYSSAPLGERSNIILDMLASSRAVLKETGDTVRAAEAEQLMAEYLGNAGISLESPPKHFRVGVLAIDPRDEAVGNAIAREGLNLQEDSGDYEPMPPRGLEVVSAIDPRFIKELNVSKLVPLDETRIGSLLKADPYSYSRLGINLPKND